jgi:ubiquinone/menaquinone biosynthesis C-methylase UbiE
MSSNGTVVSQFSKPTGWMGRYTLWRMNASHSKLTDWGLEHISIGSHFTILDVGCGGGKTISKLAAIATQGKVYGIDHSDESVAVSKRKNARWISLGRVELRHGPVSELPFSDDAFDLVTAVETHFFWPDLPADMREVWRVLKPGGTLIIVSEAYKGARRIAGNLAEKYVPPPGMKLLTANEHRELFANAGYADVQIVEDGDVGWICAMGRKPTP